VKVKRESQFILDIILPKDFRPARSLPTDDEAKALYAMWKTSPNGRGKFSLREDDKKFLSSWKVKGLVSGIAENLELTEKGRKLIVEMVTNEPNAFSANAQSPSYSELVRTKVAEKGAKPNRKEAFNLRKMRETDYPR
jgi:hypothetical protein